jgi:hypothetical protein
MSQTNNSNSSSHNSNLEERSEFSDEHSQPHGGQPQGGQTHRVLTHGVQSHGGQTLGGQVAGFNAAEDEFAAFDSALANQEEPVPEPTPAANASSADPLRAERKKSNQLEKEVRTLKTQLQRFSQINPEEYERLQQSERQKDELERQVQHREQQLTEANRRKVLNVEKERDEARQQVLALRKDRLLERLYIDAEGRVGGDERGNFFDTFSTLCAKQFRLVATDGGKDRLEPLDQKNQPLALDGVTVSAADYMEELRTHPVFSFLFQQRGGAFTNAAQELNYDKNGGPVNIQGMSTTELYLAASRKTTPQGRTP